MLNETFDSVPISRDRFFEHKPMMPDMQKVEATEDHAIFEFTAKPTLDLQNEILWWDKGLEVLEPESLRSEMIRRMEEMREYYR